MNKLLLFYRNLNELIRRSLTDNEPPVISTQERPNRVDSSPPVTRKNIKDKRKKPEIQWPSTPEITFQQLCELNNDVPKSEILKALGKQMEQHKRGKTLL